MGKFWQVSGDSWKKKRALYTNLSPVKTTSLLQSPNPDLSGPFPHLTPSNPTISRPKWNQTRRKPKNCRVTTVPRGGICSAVFMLHFLQGGARTGGWRRRTLRNLFGLCWQWPADLEASTLAVLAWRTYRSFQLLCHTARREKSRKKGWKKSQKHNSRVVRIHAKLSLISYEYFPS